MARLDFCPVKGFVPIKTLGFLGRLHVSSRKFPANVTSPCCPLRSTSERTSSKHRKRNYDEGQTRLRMWPAGTGRPFRKALLST